MAKRRLAVIALGAGALAPKALFAQGPKVHRVGILTSEGVASSKRRMDSFVSALRELGYVEGGNLVLTFRYADGDVDQLPALAKELVRTRPDVIFAPNGVAVLAVRRVAGATPVVFSNVSDPVALGLAASLARPGGTSTGLSNINTELAAKRLDLLKAAVPGIVRVAVLSDGEDSNSSRQIEMLRPAATALGLQLLITDLSRRDDLERRMAELRQWRADALYIVSGPSNTFSRALHAELATRLRLPAMAGIDFFPDAGGLMSYGPNFETLHRRAAAYVDKILKGANPGDLPVERPTVFDLVVNIQTAKALGIKVPQTILMQATRLIE